MPRKSLRPHLNQIRTWVRQGRTDAWIAHQLDVTVQDIEAFKREQGLTPEGEGGDATAGPTFVDEIDLRAEDDALIAAELEAASAARAAAEEEDEEDEGDEGSQAPRRRRGRRGGRGRRGRAANAPLEGTFDHGDEGYGLWLDPAIVDNPVYAEHWAGHRPVEVTIEEDQIVIRRTGPDAGANSDGDADAGDDER